MDSTNSRPTVTLDPRSIRAERDKYQIIIETIINSNLFDSKVHLKVSSVIFSVILLGGIFCWASASDTSNIYLFMQKYNLLLPSTGIFAIMALLFIGLFAFIPSIKNIQKNSYIQGLCNFSKQNEIFKKFILCQIEIRDSITLPGIQELYHYLKNSDAADLVFKASDFEKYLIKLLKPYLNNFPFMFISYLGLLILYNQCIERVLEQTSNSSDSEFTLILQDNIWLL